MHPFDAIVGILLAVGAVRGWSTGFFKQAGAVIGFVIAFALAAALMASAGYLLSGWFTLDPELAPIAGFVAVFVVVYALTLLIAHFAERSFEMLKLSGLNRVAGAVAGSLRAALVISLALMAVAFVGLPSPETRRDAMFYQPVSMLAPTVWSWVSSNADTFNELTRRLEVEIDRQRASGSQ